MLLTKGLNYVKMFKVLGARQQLFWMNVQANDKLEAYDIAEASQTNDWLEIETDNVIEVIEVEEEEDNG